MIQVRASLWLAISAFITRVVKLNTANPENYSVAQAFRVIA